MGQNCVTYNNGSMSWNIINKNMNIVKKFECKIVEQLLWKKIKDFMNVQDEKRVENTLKQNEWEDWINFIFLYNLDYWHLFVMRDKVCAKKKIGEMKSN